MRLGLKTILFFSIVAIFCFGFDGHSRLCKHRGWNDTMVAPLSVRVGGTAPSLDAGFGGDAALYYYAFDGASSTDYVFFAVQIPHDYIEGTTLYPHVHFAPTTTATGGVRFVLTYQWQSIAGVFGSSADIAMCYDITADSQWKHILAGNTTKAGGTRSTIAGTGKGISSILVCKLARVYNDSDDTYAADVAFLGFDIHYETDGLGSRQETSK